jgi:hypothetical protein
MTCMKLRLDLDDTYIRGAEIDRLAASSACRSSIALYLIAHPSQVRKRHDR